MLSWRSHARGLFLAPRKGIHYSIARFSVQALDRIARFGRASGSRDSLHGDEEPPTSTLQLYEAVRLVERGGSFVDGIHDHRDSSDASLRL